MNHRTKSLAPALFALVALSATPSFALDKIRFGTDWSAQAEHGGYYQAVADGTYAKYGLDVTIVQGAAQGANRALLVAGKIDFYLGGAISSLDNVAQDLPFITVAAIFQKDPQIMMTHPEAGFEKFSDLVKADKLIMSKDSLVTKFEWMKRAYPGFRDEQYVPYTFNPAVFLASPNSAQQGYVTSEPFAVEKQGGFKPKIFLFADEGYSAYSTTIETSTRLVKENPDLVQRFVDATIIGWAHYLYGDNEAGNALIKADNPEMTDAQLAFSLAKLKEYGIVVSGDAVDKGIGCITDAREKDFFGKMVAVGLFDAAMDYTRAFTTQFVCKGVGTELTR